MMGNLLLKMKQIKQAHIHCPRDMLLIGKLYKWSGTNAGDGCAWQHITSKVYVYWMKDNTMFSFEF